MRCLELLFLLPCWIFVYQSIVASVKTGASQLKVTHTASISSTRDFKNLRVLYRFHEPSSADYVLVAGTNHLYQFKADNLQNVVTRVTGPKNFSICCVPGKDVSADECVHSHVKSVQMSFPSDFCGLRETDSVVKAWSTSTVPYFELRNFSDGHSHLSSRSPVAFVNDDRVACENALYVCYNLHHGFCERLRLTNIEETSPWVGGTQASEITNKIPVAGNDATTSTAIAVGAQFVYIATESDGLQDFTIIKIHPLSARFRDFRFADSKPGHESFLSLTDNPNLPLQYKLAFRYRSYAYVDYDSHIPAPAHIYFILQQPESYHFYRWQPRMARICDDDQHFYSYVELNLACQDCIRSDYEHVAFNALRTAARGKVGKLLATTMTKQLKTIGWKTKLNDIAEVVVVAFAAHPVDPLRHRASLGQTFESFSDRAFGPFYPEPSERYGSGAILLNGSAIAVFPMAQINAKFDQVITNCLAGQGFSGPEHFLTQREREHANCVPDPSSQQKSKLVYCPTKRATNQFIMGHTHEDTLESPAFLYLPHNVTDVAVTSVSDLFTVALFTTDDGWLLKYEVTQLYESRRLDAIQLTLGGKPLTSLALDLTGTVAFVTAPDKVIRVGLSNCAAYMTCLACLNARDPYCGWCVGEGRCLRRDECSTAGWNRTGKTEEAPKRKYCEAVSQGHSLPPPVISFTWLPYTAAQTRCPIIKRVSPTGLMRLSKQQTKNSPSVFQRPIVLKLEGDLTNDIRMLVRKHTDGVSRRSASSRFDLHNGISFKTNPTNRLHCAFRQAPSGLLHSQNVLSGSVSSSELHMLLAGTSPGPLFVSTVARIEAEEENSVEVHCVSPALEQLPSIPATQASTPIILWMEWSTDQATNEVHALAPALFAIYDCTRLSDCRSCAQSRFGCVWCLLDDRCASADPASDGYLPETLCSTSVGGPVGDSTIYTNPNIIVSGQAPNCSSFKSDMKAITLMNGSALIVKFQVFNVQQPLRHFSCMEGCNGQRVMAVYNAADSTVICRIEKIDLSAQLRVFEERSSSFGKLSQPAAVNCSLDLYWHGQDTRSVEGHKMVNEDNVQVEVYTCGWLAEYCDVCLSLPERFGCGWCVSEPNPRTSHYVAGYGELPTNKCTTQSQCITQAPETRRWLQPNSICPDPQIISLLPANGTLTGQTVLHVEGRNLGRHVEDLSGGVYLDVQRHKLPCIIITGTYNRSRSFDCRLAPVNHILPTVEGRLTVEISKLRYKATSPMFHFLTPRLNVIYPERGPLAGGTWLRLTGFNLNVGARRSVSLVHIVVRSSSEEPAKSAEKNVEHNVSIPCDIDSETEHLIVCRTRELPSDWAHLMSPASKRMDKRDLNVGRGLTSVNSKVAERPAASSVDHLSMSVILWNDMTPTKPSVPYTFFYSPNPTVSAVGRQNVLAGGGTSIRVQGEFLFVIESPRLVIYFNWTKFSTPCEYILPGVLECSSPSLVPQPDNTDGMKLDHRQHNGNNSVSSLRAYDDQLTVQNTTITDHLGSMWPEASKVVLVSLSQETTDWPLKLHFGFILDGVANLRVHGYLTVHSDPIVHPFPDGLRQEELDDFTKPNPVVEPDEPQNSVLSRRNADGHNMLDTAQATEREGDNQPTPSVRVNQLLRLHGQFDALVAAPELAAKDELLVLVGDTHICLVNSVVNTEIRCDLDRSTLIAGLDYPVLVQFGRFLVYRPGVVRFVSMGQVAFRNQLIMIATGIVVLTVLVGLIAFTLWRRFDRRQRTYQAKLDQKYAEHESRVVRVFKEDFMELQTNMLEFSQGVKRHNLPYRDYRTFCLFTLFPEFHCELMVPVDPHACGSWPSSHLPDWSTPPSSDCASFVPPHPLLSPFTVPVESMDSVSKAISLFHALICNRKFLCLMVRVIEEDERTTAQDKSRLASLLCAALQPKMEHLTRVMCDLISEMLQRLHNQGDNRLPTAFRRAETVVDKLVSNWLSFLLYNFIKNNVGENLFYFYRALLQQLNMGPRDAVTGKARYTLDSSALLLSEMTGQPVMLAVEDPQKLFCLTSDHIIVKVLDCDTISQAKEKILDVIYKNKPYSEQLKPTQLDMTRLNEPAPQFSTGEFNLD
ncbi:hypothetical protein P879_01431 [Paragonimus westermani]|uniref:Sema domain-containing protein n=1 Tax=Paragonimus westermani TaxID=34504 RepID=A0A8T0D1D3_9TREM|nr:hypothetical protein P879_01431 [Paragonimus westermani]